ncbi:MAG: hypothetical protein ABI894_18245 [Ilumatobacteraceae bacterium]
MHDPCVARRGIETREYADDEKFLASLPRDPSRQVIGSRFSGCVSGQYLAAWILTRLADADTGRAVPYVVSVPA